VICNSTSVFACRGPLMLALVPFRQVWDALISVFGGFLIGPEIMGSTSSDLEAPEQQVADCFGEPLGGSASDAARLFSEDTELEAAVLDSLTDGAGPFPAVARWRSVVGAPCHSVGSRGRLSDCPRSSGPCSSQGFSLGPSTRPRSPRGGLCKLSKWG
jgi:hypothetical protein